MRPIHLALLLSISLCVSAQRKVENFVFTRADSVVLISHSITSYTTSVAEIDSVSGRKKQQPSLFLGNALNDDVVVERKRLLPKEILALSDVLLYKYPPRMILEESGCFDPHHAIIVYKNGRAEFIDVCFRCMKHIASSGFTKIDIRKDKILKLYNYFEKLGFKYEMGEEL